MQDLNHRCTCFVAGKRKTEITYPYVEFKEIKQVVKAMVSSQMAQLRERYKVNNLNPYDNPMLMLQSNFREASNYNADVQEYLEDMELYLERTETDSTYASFLKPVIFILYAKGQKTCNNLKITLHIEGSVENLYDASSCKQMNGARAKDPQLNTIDRSSEFYNFFPSEKEAYQYNQWGLKQVQKDRIIDVNSLIPGIDDNDSIPMIFVDTRWISDYTIDYKINGSDISSNGITGKLIVRVRE